MSSLSAFSRLRGRGLAVALIAGASLPAAPAAAVAATWTEFPGGSGTTQDIAAIEYQAGDRFWFATTNGGIFRSAGGPFSQRLNAPGIVFNDIEVRNNVGLAVGNAGAVYRSIDDGATWSPITMPMSNTSGCGADLALGDVQKVAFATDSVVFLFGARNQIMRSSDAGANWVNYNRNANTCRINADDAITGAFFVPGAPTVTGYLQTRNFGELYFSANDLQSGQLKSSGINGFRTAHRIVGDPANPNRQWGIAVAEGGNGSYFRRTIDGWTTSAGWETGNSRARFRDSAYDIAYAGGTVLMAGASGQIMNSIDGQTFFYVDAGGSLATQEWRAVDLAGANDAAVGGTNGTLVISRDATVTPDVVAPTGTIAGPTSGQAGQPLTFTAQVTDTGGSGIDPAGFTWTAPGLPTQGGPAVTYTFPSAGAFTVGVAFRDRSGNAATATLRVSISPAPKPQIKLPSASKPPVSVQRVKGGKIRITLKGSFGMPPGITMAQGCTGEVVLTVKKRRTLITARTTKLSRTKTRCSYRKTINIRSAKVGQAKTLRATVRFQGNAFLAAASRTYTVKVKR